MVRDVLQQNIKKVKVHDNVKSVILLFTYQRISRLPYSDSILKQHMYKYIISKFELKILDGWFYTDF